MWEIMACDAFVESLDYPSLRIGVLERDPTTLEEALKIASRLEALGAGDLEESWSDLGRRKEKFVKTSAADDYAERQELVSMVEELKLEVKHNRKKLERLRNGEARRRGSEYAAGASGHQTTLIEPVRPAQYSDYANGGAPIGYWQTPAPTPPPVPQPGASTMSEPVVFPVGYNTAPGQVPVNNMTTTNGVSHVDIPQLHRPPRSRDSGRCHLCHQVGHWKREFPRRQRRAQGASSTRSGTRTY